MAKESRLTFRVPTELKTDLEAIAFAGTSERCSDLRAYAFGSGASL